ncbi:hypothetical protein [Salinarimonas soli]|uniref:Uncharacterized protein n=1 Tax=Salinarimonas soli TaxID=1638099 RepID=A0A5B2W120_9HYPH|nr:hypothetical protein [Salinarimonas soli]KAA2244352.1 hypothetical protein F0L46_00185 [Salinarimonas soli]
MRGLIIAMDIAALLASLAAAALWLRASGRTVRRISYRETLDAADFNRIVTALNRTQILNGRAAAASGLAALFVSLRFLVDLLTR